MVNVTIKEKSRELTAKEKLIVDDYSNVIKLNDECDKAPVTIAPSYYVITTIQEDGKEPFDQIMILDKSNKKYVTGSTAFINSFLKIFNAMTEADPLEDYQISVFKKDSKNYAGRKFLTCSLL